ncbi:MAG: alkyldihydroxyacetonephosphate synthase [Myxococcota bacterium]
MEYRRDRLKWTGWGWAERSFDLHGSEQALWSFLKEGLGIGALHPMPSADIDTLPLKPSALSTSLRAALETALAPERVRTDRFERVFHAVGRSYWDLLRLRAGELEHAPDAVVYPTSTAELLALMTLAVAEGLSLIPFGGGSSIVGGVEAIRGSGHVATITVDMSEMNALLSVDPTSMTATAQAGIYGPALEAALAAQGLTLGHYPQSFEFSTLGGWIATRGAGQQSYRYGNVVDFFAGAVVVTPRGLLTAQAVPHSAAGPDLRSLIAGSEGTLGIISEATVRLQAAPAARDYRGFLFPDFQGGAEAIRLLVQEGVEVAMLRLSDAAETYFLGQLSSLGRSESWLQRTTRGALGLVGGRRPCLLLVGLEGSAAAVSASRVSVARVAMGCGGLPAGTGPGRGWYGSRFEMPYLRDALLDHGIGVGTIETATSWSNLGPLYRALRERLDGTLREVTDRGEGAPIIMAHISHAYPDGASLYFTFVFPIARQGARAQWRIIQRSAVEAVLAGGGTLSHHHGVGRIHRSWMAAEKGDLGVSMLRAVRNSLDPDGIMNPGKLLPLESD